MNDLIKSYQNLLGRKPTDREIQRLKGIRDGLEIADNDAFLIMVIICESYNESYRQIPEAIARAATAAAESAANQATENIHFAIKQLVPSVEKAVARAAEKAVNRAQLAQGMMIILLGCIIIGAIICVSFVLGSGTLLRLQNHKIDLGTFWSLTQWGIMAGLVVPPLVLGGITMLEDYEHESWGIGLICFGMAIALTIPIKLFGFIH